MKVTSSSNFIRRTRNLWPTIIVLKKRQSYFFARYSYVCFQLDCASTAACLNLPFSLFSRPLCFRIIHLNLRVNFKRTSARFLCTALYSLTPCIMSNTPRTPRLTASAFSTRSAYLYFFLTLIYLLIIISLRALKSSHFLSLLPKYSRYSS